MRTGTMKTTTTSAGQGGEIRNKGEKQLVPKAKHMDVQARDTHSGNRV